MPLRYSVVLAPPFICGSSGIRLRLSSTPAAADAAKLVRCKAQRVDAGKVHRDASDSLRCVNVQAAVRMVSQQRCDFVYRLNGAKLAVHRADGNENGIRTQKLAHFLRVNRAVPSDGEQVDLPAALLQGRSGCR